MEVGSIPATDDSVFVDDEDDTLLEAFRIFDHDNKGFICTRDLKRVMRRLGDWLTDAEIQVYKRDLVHFLGVGVPFHS